MNGVTETINEIRKFMEETVSYLHSWCCTKDGEYKMVDYRGVKMAVISLLNGSLTASKEDSHNILGTFKNGVKNGTILLSELDFSVAPSMLDAKTKNELYINHKKNVELFETKYGIKNERD